MISPSLALLVGGKGERLAVETRDRPKAMVLVAGEPFICHQLRFLVREGVKRVVLCVGYRHKQIEEYVGDGSRFGIEVLFSNDGSKPLGTGGAVRKALPLLGDCFWVMYGDSLLDIKLKPILEFFLARKEAGLMTIFKNLDQFDKSNIAVEGDLVSQYSKNKVGGDFQYIDYGISIFRKAVFEQFESGTPFGLEEVTCNLISQKDLLGYEVYQRFYEIGSVKGLEETRQYLTHKHGE